MGGKLDILEMVLSTSQDECGHELDRRDLQDEQYLKYPGSYGLPTLNNDFLTHRQNRVSFSPYPGIVSLQGYSFYISGQDQKDTLSFFFLDFFQDPLLSRLVVE